MRSRPGVITNMSYKEKQFFSFKICLNAEICNFDHKKSFSSKFQKSVGDTNLQLLRTFNKLKNIVKKEIVEENIMFRLKNLQMRKCISLIVFLRPFL